MVRGCGDGAEECREGWVRKEGGDGLYDRLRRTRGMLAAEEVLRKRGEMM